jgi:hypothetical protein
MTKNMLNRLIPLIITFVITATICISQDLPPCEPDSSFLLSDAIVFPDPVIDDTTGIGIYKAACINTPYVLPIFIRPPSSIVFNGFPIAINSFTIDSVRNLPAGIEFKCSTPDCVFPPDSVSCIFIIGSATEDNDTGIYSLEVDLTATALGFPIMISFPDTSGSTLLPMGRYDLILHPEGHPGCEETTLSRQDLTLNSQVLNIAPNPTYQMVNVNWNSKNRGMAHFQMFSSSGALIMDKQIESLAGSNNTTINIEDAPPGLYLVKMQLQNQTFQNKLIKL